MAALLCGRAFEPTPRSAPGPPPALRGCVAAAPVIAGASAGFAPGAANAAATAAAFGIEPYWLLVGFCVAVVCYGAVAKMSGQPDQAQGGYGVAMRQAKEIDNPEKAEKTTAPRAPTQSSTPIPVGPAETPTKTSMGRRGIVRSFSDLPKTRSLGIELRYTSALAAPVSVVDGSFVQEPCRIRHSEQLGADQEQNAKVVSETVRRLVEHFEWKGVIGCSISTKVAHFLGCPASVQSFAVMEEKVNSLLNKALRSKIKYTVSMVHARAAGYNELVYGGSAHEACWHDKVVIMCTLGKNISAMLFNDGHRVRGKEFISVTDEEETTGHSPEWIKLNSTPAYEPPMPGSPLFDEWADYVDQQFSRIITSVPKVDRIVVVPTGRTARLSDELNQALRPKLRRTRANAAAKNCLVILQDTQEGAVVRGAGLGALVEMQSSQMMAEMAPLLSGAKTLQALSESQLSSIFDTIDEDGDGQLSFGELHHGLETLGITRYEDALMHELDPEVDTPMHEMHVRLPEFVHWWVRHVTDARVVSVTSADAWYQVLQSVEPGFGDLIMLEVTFTFCPACRKFEPKFKKMSEKYKHVRFVKLVADGTVGSMELCNKELNVTGSPTFFVFRRGGQLVRKWTGVSLSDFNKNLAACISEDPEAEPVPVLHEVDRSAPTWGAAEAEVVTPAATVTVTPAATVTRSYPDPKQKSRFGTRRWP